jgi:putative solute:sodium symporter small subunit
MSDQSEQEIVLPSDQPKQLSDDQAAYWRANVTTLLSLLSVWFLVSFGCGILWVDALNQYQFFGWKLGFWFSQQGAIYVFVILIFIYVVRMNALDRRFNVDEDQ